MTTNIYAEDPDKHFDVKDYILCDQCAWNGFPNEKNC